MRQKGEIKWQKRQNQKEARSRKESGQRRQSATRRSRTKSVSGQSESDSKGAKKE